MSGAPQHAIPNDFTIRAPSIPVWVHSPYLNWLVPADRLTDNWTWHVRNDKVSSLTILLRTAAGVFNLLGPVGTTAGQACFSHPWWSDVSISPLPQVGFTSVRPTSTVVSYEGAGVVVNITFSSPRFLHALDTYRPILDLTIHVVAVHESAGNVSLFLEMAGQHAVDQDTQSVSWGRDAWMDDDIAHSMYMRHDPQVPFDTISPTQPVEHLNWGTAHLTVPVAVSSGAAVSSWLGSSNRARHSFASSGRLPQDGDETVMPLPACGGGGGGGGDITCTCACTEGGTGENNEWPSMAVVWSLGVLAPGAASRVGALLSNDDLGMSVRFFGENLPEYWRREGLTFESIIVNATRSFDQDVEACSTYDLALVDELLEVGGEDYALIAALSYRQVLGDNSLVWYRGGFRGATAPASMMFVKGLGSSGDTGTIDDNYPAALFFLWGEPELLHALLRPVNMFMGNETYDPSLPFPRNVTWTEPYSIHYLGQYPVAELQCWESIPSMEHCEPMPLEMTADNLQMTIAATLLTNDTSAAHMYYSLLHQYAQYLVDNGLFPTKQLCSDDYEGPSANNSNLAAKSIIAIGAFGLLEKLLGNQSSADHFLDISRDYARQWRQFTSGGRKGATRRSYDLADSWSLKYNLIWDRVFGLHLFDDVIESECEFYMAPNSTVRQKYGWYLDDRSETDERHLTNSGWVEWVAAMCGEKAVADVYARLRTFAETTPDRWALTDYYNALDGRRIGFEGRAQMGGFGASLLLSKYPQGICAGVL